MIFLSNRKLKLMIITLLLLIFCFFIGMFKPKAYTQTNYINCAFSGNAPISDLIDSTFYSRAPINCSGNQYEPMINYGEGTLIFSFGAQNYDSTSGQWHEIIGVTITGDGEYVCDLGSTTQWLDNGTQYIVTTAKCPVKFSNGQGINSINFQRNGGTGRVNIKLSEFATFVSKDTANVNVNQQEVVNAINSSQQQMITQIQNQTQSINDIKDTIKDDSIDTNNANSSASSWNNKNATNGTITQLLTLPITLLNAIVSGISTSCSSFSLGSLFGTNITLPCINLSNIIGSALFSTIDILFSGFMIFAISKKFIKIFNDFTNLKSNQIDELYGGGN